MHNDGVQIARPQKHSVRTSGGQAIPTILFVFSNRPSSLVARKPMPLPLRVQQCLGLMAFLFVEASVQGQEWGAKMFDRTEIKFGNVARLADTTFKLKIKNRYVDTIQITSLTTSCGCISWIERAPLTLASKEEKELTIRLDTIRHVGEKNVRAIVSLYEPTHGFSDTVTIPVTGTIRQDFEVRPSNVGFGTIDLGVGYTQRIGIHYTGGRSDWKIIHAKVGNPHCTTEVVEKSRSAGLVTYDVLVVINNTAPRGHLRDQLILTTNDNGSSQVSIPVEARIEADIVVTDVQFGTLVPGQPKSMNLIVRGRKPFKINEISHLIHEVTLKPNLDSSQSPTVVDAFPENSAGLPDQSFKITCPETLASVHMIPVTITPPAEAGLFEEEFVLKIEGRNRTVTFKAKGRILDPATTPDKK